MHHAGKDGIGTPSRSLKLEVPGLALDVLSLASLIPRLLGSLAIAVSAVFIAVGGCIACFGREGECPLGSGGTVDLAAEPIDVAPACEKLLTSSPSRVTDKSCSGPRA